MSFHYLYVDIEKKNWGQDSNVHPDDHTLDHSTTMPMSSKFEDKITLFENFWGPILQVERSPSEGVWQPEQAWLVFQPVMRDNCWFRLPIEGMPDGR